MANFSSLKQAIQNYIKENGNKEITGNLLQEILLSMVVTMGDNAVNGVLQSLSNEMIARENADGLLNQALTTEQQRAIAAETKSAVLEGETKTLVFKNAAGQELYKVSVASLISNGLVDVEVDGTNLVMTFHTESGDEEITISIGDIFSPSNYYTKTQVDGLLLPITTAITNVSSRLNEGYIYLGVADPETIPTSAIGKFFYIATQAGTYHFMTNGDIPIVISSNGLYILSGGAEADDWYLETIAVFTNNVQFNNAQLITSGGVFNAILPINDLLRRNYMLAGVADTTTIPTEDTNVFYLAGQGGIYTHFLNGDEEPLVLPKGLTMIYRGVEDDGWNYWVVYADNDFINTNRAQELTSNQQTEAQNNLEGKLYEPAQFSGLGKKMLAKNIQQVGGVSKNVMTQAFFEDEQGNALTNTVFVIQYDFSLGEVSTNNITIGSSNTATINNTTYYYETVSLAAGKALHLLDTTNCVLLNGTTALLGSNDVIAHEATTVYIASTTSGTYSDAYKVDNFITVPANCVLDFDGGSLSNGTLIADEVKILGCDNCFGYNLSIAVSSQDIYYSWFAEDEIEDIIERITNLSLTATPIKFYIDRNVSIAKTIIIDANKIIINGLNNVITCNGCDGIKIHKSGLRGMATTVLSNIQFDGVDATTKGIIIQGENGSTVHSVEIQNCKLFNFSTGAWFGDQNWLITYDNCAFYNNIIGLESKIGGINSGENIRIRGSVIANNDRGIRCPNMEFFVEGSSFDYNVIDIVCGVTGDVFITNCHIEKRFGALCGRNGQTQAGYVASGYVKLIAVNSNFTIFANSNYANDALFGVTSHGSINLSACSFYIPNRIKYISKGSEASFVMSGSLQYGTCNFDYISPNAPNIAEPVVSNLFKFLDKAPTVTVWEGANGAFQTQNVGTCVFYIPLNNTGLGSFACTAMNDMSSDLFKKLTIKEGYWNKGVFTETKTIANEVELRLAQNNSYNVNFVSWHCNCLQVTIINVIGDTKTLKFEVNLENAEKSIVGNVEDIDELKYNTPFREFNYTPTKKRIRVIGHGVAVDMNGNDYNTRRNALPTNANDGFIMFKPNQGAKLLRLRDEWYMLNPMPRFDESNLVKFGGITANRPTDGSLIYVGFIYFDTTLGKPIWAKSIASSEPYTITWVDALGNPVDTVYPKVMGTPTNGNLAKFNGTNIEDAEVAPTV